MSDVCVVIPTVSRTDRLGNIIEDGSKLFIDLLSFTNKNRELAINLYYILNSKELVNDIDGALFDEFGLVKLSSIIGKLDLKGILDGTADLNRIGAKHNINDVNGNKKEFNNIFEAYDALNEVNENEEEYVALLDDNHHIILARTDSGFSFVKADTKFKSELSNSMLSFLQQIGFTIELTDDNNNMFDAVFNPSNVLETANGLKAIILIANNERSEASLSEEFSHLLIEGLSHTLLVLNLLNNMMTRVNGRYVLIELALGDKYQTYVSLYTEGGELNISRLAKEAAGHLLKNAFENRESISYDQSLELEYYSNPCKNFINRIKKFILDIFNKISPKSIDFLMNQSLERANYIAGKFFNNRESLADEIRKSGLNNINQSEALYATERTMTLLDSLIERGKNLIYKNYRIEKAYINRGISEGKDEVPILGSAGYGLANIDNYMKSRYSKILQMNGMTNDGDVFNSLLILRSLIEFVLKSFLTLHNAILNININDSANNLNEIRKISEILNYAKNIINGYRQFMNDIRNIEYIISLIEGVDISMYKAEIDSIRSYVLGTSLSSIIDDVSAKYLLLRKKNCLNFIKNYFTEFTIDYGPMKGTKITAEAILDCAQAEPGLLDRTVRGMFENKDPLLNILNSILSNTKNRNLQALTSFEGSIRSMQESLEKLGLTSDFMYETIDGKKTGMLISDWNWAQYYLDRREYRLSLKEQNLKYNQIKQAMDEWEIQHTLHITEFYGLKLMKSVKVPFDPTGNNRYDNKVKIDQILNETLMAYYKDYILAKNRLDAMLPEGKAHLFRAVQKRKESDEKLMDIIRNPNSESIKSSLKDSIKDMYSVMEDDEEYAGAIDSGRQNVSGKNTFTNFDNTPYRLIPVLYTRMLGDKEVLSTDASSSLVAYAAMAINYKSLLNIVDNFLLIEDYIREEREAYDEKFYEKKNGKKVLLKGRNTKAADLLNDWMDANFFGNSKDIEQITIAGHKINLGKFFDKMRMFTTHSRLSWNAVTSTMNVIDNSILSILETVQKENFNKDTLARAEKDFATGIFEYMKEANSANPHNRMFLKIRKFNLMEDYEDSLKSAGIRLGLVSRIIGLNIALLDMHVGELHNHVVPGDAILKTTVVYDENGNLVDYDFLLEEIQRKDANGRVFYDLMPKKGTYYLDSEGNKHNIFISDSYEDIDKLANMSQDEMTLELLDLLNRYNKELSAILEFDLRLINQIHRCNQGNNGAMSLIDRGTMNRAVIFRLGMQFRLWMVDYYDKRYGLAYYDAKTNQWRIPYLRYALEFCFNWAREFYRTSIKLHKEGEQIKKYAWKSLNNKEKAMIKRAGAEFALLMLTVFASIWMAGGMHLFGDDNDDKSKSHPWTGTWWAPIGRFLYMLTLRSKLEMKSSVPSLYTLLSFALIFKNPFPFLDDFLKLIDLINPEYIYTNIQKTTKNPLWGVSNQYLIDLMNRGFPLNRTIWKNTVQLSWGTNDNPYKFYLK